MKLGFIGLGSMGQGMARNLLRAGHELTVYNRSRDKAESLGQNGAVVAATPAEAAAGDAVITMVSDDQALEEVLFGRHGVLAAAHAETVHISCSTISVALSKRLAETHRNEQQFYIAAPVFGRPEAAEAGKLVVVAAGPVEAIEKCRPALEAISQKVFVAGEEAHRANIIKIAGNFLFLAMLESLGESFGLLRKSGIDPKFFLEIVNGQLLRSPVYENYGKIIADEKYEPAGFKLRLGLKDSKLALAAAEEAAMPMPLASLVHDHLLSGMARGYGEIDWAALGKVVAENGGLTGARK